MTELVFRDASVEVRVTGDDAIVHHRALDKYYHAPRSSLPQHYREHLAPYHSRVSAMAANVFLAIAVTLLALNLIAITRISIAGATRWAPLVLVAYTGVNLAIHEGAHIVALRLLGRRIDKVGFKMHYYILPAFYVRMNQSHLLSKHERMIVHGAGAFVNLTVNLVLILTLWDRFPDLNVALKFVGWAIAINALPVLNSDGYRVVLALADHAERRSIHQNPHWIIMVKYLSVVLVSAYGLSLTYSALTEVFT